MKKLKAFTLIEALVAMAVLSAVVTVSFMTVEWVLNSTRLPQDFRARVAMETVAVETGDTGRYYDETVQQGGFTVEKKLEPVPGMKKYFWVHFTCYDGTNKKLAKQTRLVYLP